MNKSLLNYFLKNKHKLRLIKGSDLSCGFSSIVTDGIVICEVNTWELQNQLYGVEFLDQQVYPCTRKLLFPFFLIDEDKNIKPKSTSYYKTKVIINDCYVYERETNQQEYANREDKYILLNKKHLPKTYYPERVFAANRSDLILFERFGGIGMMRSKLTEENLDVIKRIFE